MSSRLHAVLRFLLYTWALVLVVWAVDRVGLLRTTPPATSGCSARDAKTASDFTVRVADAVCREESQQPSEPESVALACAIEGAAGAVAHVLFPREQWDVIRGRKPAPCTTAGKSTFDAGPGK